jgi:hemerythrin superfamily protein
MLITEALHADHSAVRQHIAMLHAHPNEARQHYPIIAAMLRAHGPAEEQTLYRALERLPQMTDQMARSEREHANLGALLARVDQTAYGHPVWMTRFEQMVRALESHLATEESVVFQRTRELLSLPAQRALGMKYERLMRRHVLARGAARAKSMWGHLLDLVLPHPMLRPR